MVVIGVDRVGFNHVVGIASKTMKRSGWVTGAVVIQVFWMLALVALPIYLLFLTRSSGILNVPDGKEAAHGLKVWAAVVAVPAVLAIASAYGLWKEKLWGWWIALVSNTVILGLFIYSMTDENTIAWDMVAVTLVSAGLPILLMLTVVRKFYWRVTESA
jgi:hypothetical protein